MPAHRPDQPGCPNAPGRRPLPDPLAVRLCLIPDPAPPYDSGTEGVPSTERAPGAEGRPPGGRLPDRQDDGGPEHDGRAEYDRRPGGPADDDRRPGDRADDDRRPGDREQTGRADGGAARSPAWPSRFAQVLAETLAGSRPPYQMVPWTTEMARTHIGRLGPQLASDQRPRVRRVVTFHPTRDAMEMTVVASFGPRVHALAVRMERDTTRESHPPRWLCTAVEAA